MNANVNVISAQPAPSNTAKVSSAQPAVFPNVVRIRACATFRGALIAEILNRASRGCRSNRPVGTLYAATRYRPSPSEAARERTSSPMDAVCVFWSSPTALNGCTIRTFEEVQQLTVLLAIASE